MFGEKKRSILGCICLLVLLSIVLLMVDYFMCKLCISTHINTQTVYSVTNHIESGFKHFVSQPIKYIYTTFDISGLGNLMFQYASLIGIAHSSHMRPVIPKDCKLNRIFQLPVTSRNSARPGLDWGKVVEPRSSAYDKVIAKLFIDDNVEVVGFLQSWKYFDEIKDEIIKHFKFRKEIDKSAEDFINNSLKDLKSNRSSTDKKYPGKESTVVTYPYHIGSAVVNVTFHGPGDNTGLASSRIPLFHLAHHITNRINHKDIHRNIEKYMKYGYKHYDCYDVGSSLDCYPSNNTSDRKGINRPDPKRVEEPILIGVHIRRGDMLTNQKHVEYGYTVADAEYLQDAVKYY